LNKRALLIALASTGIDTLQKLSTLTRIDLSRLSRIANGHVRASPSQKSAIATALRAPIEQLFAEGSQ
jgi:hypothetical protein